MPLLGKRQATQLDSERIPAEFVCPITQTIMLNPVTLICGHVFTDSALREWLQLNDDSCPHGCDLGPVPLVMKHVFLRARIHKYLDLHPDLADDCKSSINVGKAMVNFFVRNNQDWNEDAPAVEEPGYCEPGGKMKSNHNSRVNSRALPGMPKEGKHRHQEANKVKLQVPFTSEICIYNRSANQCQCKATHFALNSNFDRIGSFHRALESQLKSNAISQATYEQMMRILDGDIDEAKSRAKKPRTLLFCQMHARHHGKQRQELFPDSRTLGDLTTQQTSRLIEAIVESFVKVLAEPAQ